MTIILTIIAAVLVIIGLVVFNVRSASSQDKPEHEDNAAAEAGIPHVQEEAPEQVEADQQDPFEMNDQTYRAILQKLQHPKEEKKHSEKTEMDDMDYRKALKSMKKREQD
ncbi:hypothetical protein OIO07_19005 [Bacillus paralicheniformis]|jgi:hypothetical protein|uniref:hypothetical protein n=1 Tax=Bacillus TaxID=1386 RepID=UPI0003423288|nr:MULTISPECIES: hypothetical protein [Bacillus]ETB70652.1 hypothetical protein A943_11305 [Bacillus sp. CPSM8]KJD54020.1 hypothetical protein UZ38_29550 [Bacillus amyloliquefaciens]KUL08826.1 hypothetical protein LI7559_13890 [Bacillus licheniformis LMG 7559]AGN35440.1 YhcC [Bacillus paralicheniformis ATCC 9945a]AYQ15532.1 hypothetical protein D5285_05385 [Bacillus paralicheniformis]